MNRSTSIFLCVALLNLIACSSQPLKQASSHSSDYNQKSGKLVSIRENGKFGYINLDGQVVIEPQFDDTHFFSEGLAAVKIGNQWGFIDRMGKMVIKPQFDNAYFFSQGLAPVKIDNKVGFIEGTGRIVIKLQLNSYYSITQGWS